MEQIAPLKPHHASADFGRVPVFESAAVNGPVAIGFLDRRILVPIDFAAEYSADEQRLALEHELIHHRRGDLWWNGAALAALAVNWFNPIAYLAYRALRADQELACDAAVARKAPTKRLQYASALLKSATDFKNPIAACPLDRTTDLKRRLKMMKNHRASLGRSLAGISAMAALGGAGLAIAGPSAALTQSQGAPSHPQQHVSVEKAITPFPGPSKTLVKLNERHLAAPLPASCNKAEDRFEVDVGAGPSVNDKLLFSVCNSGTTSADMIATLEQAMTHIGSDGEMPAAHRAKILPALQAEIARRKAA